MNGPPSREHLAVVGIGQVLPGAASLGALWSNILVGQSAFGEVPPERGDLTPYIDSECAGVDALPHWRGAFLRANAVDVSELRLTPKARARTNPMHFAIVRAAGAALDDATSGGAAFARVSTGFVLGTAGLGLSGDLSLAVRIGPILSEIDLALDQCGLEQSHRAAALDGIRARLATKLSPATEDDVLGAVGSIAVGRAMQILGLGGAHLVVDAGGASGLAALDVAWDWLAAGDADTMLVGGASAWTFPVEQASWARARRLTREVPRPFALAADGTLLGEGAVVLVVRRLSDALRGRERVHAIVRSVAGALCAASQRVAPPGPEAYRRAFSAAVAAARVDASSVGFVECNASGLAREDDAELIAVSEFYGEARKADGPLHLGTVKALLGDLRGASGLLGLVKVALVGQNRRLPAEVDVGPVSDRLDGRRLRRSLEAQAWRDGAGPFLAVTASSECGTVYHAILEAPSMTDAQRAAEPRTKTASTAIVGLGAILPDAPDIPAFWRHTLNGHVSLTPPVGVPNGAVAGRLIAAVRDAAGYGVLPATFPRLDPSVLLAVDAGREAARDGSRTLEQFPPERVAVFFATAPERAREHDAAGRMALAEVVAALRFELATTPRATAALALRAARERIENLLPPITEDFLVAATGASLAVRVGRAVGASAVAFGVESACASSLAATAIACRALSSGRIDAALVGGVSDSIGAEAEMTFTAIRGLSTVGLFAFDARADGFVLGEGAAAMVLVRGTDVSRDTRPVYATLCGSAGTSDGPWPSRFAPSPEAQARACSLALRASGLLPADVDYLECHGTGTPVGDAAEVHAYRLAYGAHGRSAPIALGSAKPHVGHLNAAAGAVGLVRAALGLARRQLPGTAGFDRPNPDLPLAAGPFVVQKDAASWPASEGGRPRRAAVSAFGLGGTNFHVLLEEWWGAHEPRPQPPSDHQWSLFDERQALPGRATLYRRRVDLSRDLYLREHLIAGKPVIPGAFSCELIAQAGTLTTPGLTLIGLEDVRFEMVLQVPEAGMEIQARVSHPVPRAGGGGQVETEILVTSEFSPPAHTNRVVQRVHCRGRAVCGPQAPAPRAVDPATLAVSRRPGRDYASVYSDHAYCHLGPLFQSIRATVLDGPTAIVARLEVPSEDQLIAHTSAPRFALGPLLFDNYLQVAGTLAVYRDHRFPLPSRLARIHVWDRPRPGEVVWAAARLVDQDDDEQVFDIDVFDAEGHIRCRCEGFVTRSLGPFSDMELKTFYQGLTGGAPELRPLGSAGGAER